MKKIIAVFLSVHLVLFASFFYLQRYVASPQEQGDEAVSYTPDKALVLAGRFENILNHLTEVTTHKVEDYTLNDDGTYTVFTRVDTENGEQKAVALFAPDEESNLGYQLIYCDIFDLSSVSYM